MLLLSLLPGSIALALALLTLSAKHLPGLDQFMPALPLIPVFYWGLLRSRDMPYWFVFVLGLLVDAVDGQPLGLSSLLFILFLALLHAQQKFVQKEGFLLQWAYFALLFAVCESLRWIMLSLFEGRAQTIQAAAFQWLLTVCIYPSLHHLFDQLHHYVHARRWRVMHGR